MKKKYALFMCSNFIANNFTHLLDFENDKDAREFFTSGTVVYPGVRKAGDKYFLLAEAEVGENYVNAGDAKWELPLFGGTIICETMPIFRNEKV